MKKPKQLDLLMLVLFSFKQDVLKDIAEGEHAMQVLLLVYDNEAVDTRAAYRIEDGAELVIHGTGIYAREFLLGR